MNKLLSLGGIYLDSNDLKTFKLRAILIGFIWALGISFFLALLLGVILHYTSLSSALLPSFAALIFFLSILFGGTIAARSAGNNGLLNGIAVGIVYLIISVAINTISSPVSLGLVAFFKKLAYSLVAGALGGIIGVGLADKN